MVRSLFEGDVRREAIDESIESLLNLGSLTTKQLDIAEREGLYRNAAQYTGFYHEINTLIALLYRRDPKFIAIPSFHRADQSSRQMSANMHSRAHSAVHCAILREMRKPMALVQTEGAVQKYEQELARLRSVSSDSVLHPLTCGRVTKEDVTRVMLARENMRKMLAMSKTSPKYAVQDWDEE
jgi:transcriptional regulator with PAS, ATPase and Fis domain